MKKVVDGIEEVSGPPLKETCRAGMKVRQESQPSLKPTARAEDFLQRVQMDLEGPLLSTKRGNRYMLSLQDDVTGLQFTKFLKHKNEAPNAFVTLITDLENLSDLKLKCWRSDFGSEFHNYKFKDYAGLCQG